VRPVRPLSNPGQPFRAALTAIWCGAFLVLTLCWATGAAEAHPGMRIPIEDPVVLDAPSTAPPPLVETRPVPLRPDLKESPQAATPSTAWIWVALLALPAAAAVARQHWPRALVLALVLLRQREPVSRDTDDLSWIVYVVRTCLGQLTDAIGFLIRAPESLVDGWAWDLNR
jgi:hypothetical protein